ncbi:hypothetical protein GWI33_010390 [Rhynchophorus ferrugineus]|uniref:Uncharacterized protein n=1 Tax=Rhynchophorus ferrugineus TaxID=354439 RepID=A0A834MIZ4_RHYFE|nr:hypothetical protein GWI33_010390 [Rhynchophorus ferrugineus]
MNFDIFCRSDLTSKLLLRGAPDASSPAFWPSEPTDRPLCATHTIYHQLVTVKCQIHKPSILARERGVHPSRSGNRAPSSSGAASRTRTRPPPAAVSAAGGGGGGPPMTQPFPGPADKQTVAPATTPSLFRPVTTTPPRVLLPPVASISAAPSSRTQQKDTTPRRQSYDKLVSDQGGGAVDGGGEGDTAEEYPTPYADITSKMCLYARNRHRRAVGHDYGGEGSPPPVGQPGV